MVRVSLKQARSNFKKLIDEVAVGEEVVLTRRGVEVARLIPPPAKSKSLPSLAAFRASIKLKGKPRDVVVAAREAERS